MKDVSLVKTQDTCFPEFGVYLFWAWFISAYGNITCPVILDRVWVCSPHCSMKQICDWRAIFHPKPLKSGSLNPTRLNHHTILQWALTTSGRHSLEEKGEVQKSLQTSCEWLVLLQIDGRDETEYSFSILQHTVRELFLTRPTRKFLLCLPSAFGTIILNDKLCICFDHARQLEAGNLF